MPLFVFSQSLDQILGLNSKPEFYKYLSIPEKKLYDSLSDEVKQKINTIYNSVKEKNLKNNILTNSNYQSNPNNRVNPYIPNRLNPNFNRQNSPSKSPNRNSTPETNPFHGTPLEKYFTNSQQADESPGNGFDLNLPPLTEEEMKNLPKLGVGGEDADCSNFGVSGNMNGTTAILRFDTARLCRMFGRKIKVIDAKRSCSNSSRHCLGEAMDYEIRAFGDRKTQALLVIALIGLGYNTASYTYNFPLHSDHERSGKWKTWSGVTGTNYRGTNSRPYDIAIRDALHLIGKPANSASEFRSKYGNPTKNEMSERSLKYLKQFGGELKPVPGVI